MVGATSDGACENGDIVWEVVVGKGKQRNADADCGGGSTIQAQYDAVGVGPMSIFMGSFFSPLWGAYFSVAVPIVAVLHGNQRILKDTTQREVVGTDPVIQRIKFSDFLCLFCLF